MRQICYSVTSTKLHSCLGASFNDESGQKYLVAIDAPDAATPRRGEIFSRSPTGFDRTPLDKQSHNEYA
ncbi:MAG TPA: hypothetical protein DCY88_05665 [Cyanobacteria bacterium UBA11372]|nr:hypothetical protein [Cyanobacteria bacterium UBA11372]